MATTYNTVKLKKYLDIVEEYTAASAITPGDLVELTSAGLVQRHSTAGGNAVRMFALENELEGEGLSDDYAAGDKVQVWCAVPGEIVYARLADEQNATLANFLESAGNGCLQVHSSDAIAETIASAEDQSALSLAITVYPMQIVGQILESQDLSGLETSESSAVGNSQWVKVRIV